MYEALRELQRREATELRPSWDQLRFNAEKESGVLNWEDVPAESWQKVHAQLYASAVNVWKNAATIALLDAPDIDANEPLLANSIRNNMTFHLNRYQFLSKLGILVRETNVAQELVVGRLMTGIPNDIARDSRLQTTAGVATAYGELIGGSAGRIVAGAGGGAVDAAVEKAQDTIEKAAQKPAGAALVGLLIAGVLVLVFSK